MVVEAAQFWEVPTRNGLGSVRRETVNGREYLVAPATTIVPGVLPGSQGPLYYPEHQIKRNVKDWDGIPITVHHPYTSNGEHVSVNDPSALDRRVGVIKRSTYNGKLQHEAWFDAKRTRQVDKRVYDALNSNTPMELSTGLLIGTMTPAEPGAAYNGIPYNYITGNYRPDHLAILPDQTGACSLQDGCGLLINRKTQPERDTVANQSPSLVEQFVRWLVGNQGRHPETKQFQPEFKPAVKKGFTQGLTHDTSGEAIDSEDDKVGQGDRDVEEGEIKRESSAVSNLGGDGSDVSTADSGNVVSLQAGTGEDELQGIKAKKPTNPKIVKPRKAVEADSAEAQTRIQTQANGGKMPPVINVDPALLARVGDGGKVSKMACSASDNATTKGTPFAHKQAASAHREAAEAHEDAGNDEMATGHKAIAKQHAASARNLVSNREILMNLPKDKTQRAIRLKEFRPKMLEFLTTNCNCPKEKAAYNELNDNTLYAVYNAKKDSSNEDVVGGGSDQAGGEEDTDEHDYESKDNFTAKTKSGGNAFKKAMTENEWLEMAPPEVRERDAYAKKVLNREKLSLVQKLVANVADTDRRQALGNKLMRCSLEDLVERVELLPARPQTRNAYQDEPAPQFVGATGGRPTTTNTADNDDVLETYTLNFKVPYNDEQAVVRVG